MLLTGIIHLVQYDAKIVTAGWVSASWLSLKPAGSHKRDWVMLVSGVKGLTSMAVEHG